MPDLLYLVHNLEMKLLVIDDHPVLRDGLTALLKQSGPGTEVFQASSADEGLKLVEQHNDFDAVLLDLLMPGLGGFSAISEFGKMRPDLPVVVLSSSEDPKDVHRALSLGALGYVPKSASSHVLLSAIRLVLSGELYVPPLVLNKQSSIIGRVESGIQNGAGRLTERQVEVLGLLSKGQPNKTIATTLDLSEKTVKAHVTAIFRALNVVNRTQAAQVGRVAGLIRES